ncbi:MAG: NUDIX hydrolase [Phycisphaerales bacterium JB064]
MSVTLLELPERRGLRLEVRGAMPSQDPAIEAAWQAACSANPKLFDGPILSVRGIDAGGGVIHAAADRFSHVVCNRPGRSMATTILSVTGVIESSIGNRPCVLLARRGRSTRSYPGMWEFAPAGGLHVPERRGALGLGHVLETLRTELAEEVGVTAHLEQARAVALVADADARSLDIIVRAHIAGPAPVLRIGGEHAWECSEARWVFVDEVASFLRDAEGGVIEPTLEIARWLGWM